MVTLMLKLEFLMATMETNRVITEDVVKRAFDFYDEARLHNNSVEEEWGDNNRRLEESVWDVL